MEFSLCFISLSREAPFSQQRRIACGLATEFSVWGWLCVCVRERAPHFYALVVKNIQVPKACFAPLTVLVRPWSSVIECWESLICHYHRKHTHVCKWHEQSFCFGNDNTFYMYHVCYIYHMQSQIVERKKVLRIMGKQNFYCRNLSSESLVYLESLPMKWIQTKLNI